MEKLDEEFSCEHCHFSIQKLKQMAEKGGSKEMFSTFGGRAHMNIYEVNVTSNFLDFRRSTGKFTKKLKISALMRLHDMIHSGEVGLDPDEIDRLWIDGKRETFQGGNYISGLLRHLGCKEIAAGC